MLLTKNKIISLAFLLCSVFYICQVFLVTPAQATLDKYHVTESQLQLLGLSIAVPYIVIWFIALIGYPRLQTYNRLIKGSPDGKGISLITVGVLWLGLWLPISTIANNLASGYYASHPETTANLVRAVNYINIAILFPAFLAIYYGAKRLLPLIKRKPSFVAPTQTATILYLCFSALYVMLVLHDPSRQYPAGSVAVGSYYEPDWLIIITIIIPRLIMWYLGMQAALYMHMYSTKVNGTIYRNALKNLSRGIGGVVLATILLRIVQSLTTLINDLSLGLLLIFVYFLLLCISIGYVLIAKGAKNLQRLEEI